MLVDAGLEHESPPLAQVKPSHGIKNPCDVPDLQVSILLRQLFPWIAAAGAERGLPQVRFDLGAQENWISQSI